MNDHVVLWAVVIAAAVCIGVFVSDRALANYQASDIFYTNKDPYQPRIPYKPRHSPPDAGEMPESKPIPDGGFPSDELWDSFMNSNPDADTINDISDKLQELSDTLNEQAELICEDAGCPVCPTFEQYYSLYFDGYENDSEMRARAKSLYNKHKSKYGTIAC